MVHVRMDGGPHFRGTFEDRLHSLIIHPVTDSSMLHSDKQTITQEVHEVWQGLQDSPLRPEQYHLDK